MRPLAQRRVKPLRASLIQDSRFLNPQPEGVLEHVRFHVSGWGTDRQLDERPGVPRERRIPEPVGRAHWSVPEQQLSLPLPIVAAERRLTPVYSTSVPLRGLSGRLRRLAYKHPDCHARRWTLLRVADRVDVLEHAPPRVVRTLGALGLFALGLSVARFRRR